MDEMIGRVDMVEMRPTLDHWKARGLDFSVILHNPHVPSRVGRRCLKPQDHGLEEALDHVLLERARPALESGAPVEFSSTIRNVHRAVGTMLSGEIARRYGSKGLPDDTIRIHFTGSAGQSFGAFLMGGVTVFLEGEVNDYAGKGLSGGRMIVFPPKGSAFAPEANILIGNTVLYGATGGEAYFNGVAGERFAVRNSGATAVVEGVGDHACEYMTNGTVVVLGATGRNFAAGMSGGLAYVFDKTGDFARFGCNRTAVDLEPIFEREDIARLEYLLRRHFDFTGSPLAQRILDQWSEMLPSFVKVFPHEYRRALADQVEPMKIPTIPDSATNVAAAGDRSR